MCFNERLFLNGRYLDKPDKFIKGMSKEIVTAEANREGLNADKIRHFFGVMGGKTRAADVYLEEFTRFDVRRLREETGKRVSNALLDVDDCTAYPYGPFPDKNLGHIDNLKRDGVGIGVYSNCKAMERLAPLREMNVPIYGGDVAKPAGSGFIEVCGTMDFDPAETWMVDDNPLTGGGAVGVLEGVAFVKPMGVNPEYVAFKKRLKLAFSGLLRKIAIARTLQGNGKILRY